MLICFNLVCSCSHGQKLISIFRKKNRCSYSYKIPYLHNFLISLSTSKVLLRKAFLIIYNLYNRLLIKWKNRLPVQSRKRVSLKLLPTTFSVTSAPIVPSENVFYYPFTVYLAYRFSEILATDQLPKIMGASQNI